VSGEDVTFVAGRCVPYGEGITFWPLREIVAGLTAAAPLAELLAAEEQGELIADRIGEAVGLAGTPSSSEEIFLAFRRLFEAVARERPLVVLFEDLHWAEPTFLDLVEYLAERLREAPVLLLCLARPELLEERPAWGGGKRNASSLFLERLSEAECERLIDNLSAELPDPTRARALEAADGNPLFLEQILIMLDEGEIAAGEVPIPPTIEAVLAARLDRLGPGERAVIERAAVVGKEFRGAAVFELLPDDARPFAAPHLETLVRKDLVEPEVTHGPSSDAFRFRHVLIQRAAYRTIPKRLRSELHERVAAWLEADAGEEGAE
jgi:predicted ATPase